MLPTVIRWTLFGFSFGLCFPLGALYIDILLSDLEFSWQGIKHAHAQNFLHWIIDSAPIILGLMGLIIGIYRYRLELHTENLEILVGNRTLQLEHHQHELSEFLNSAPVMMWMTDPQGKPLIYNEAWLNFTRRDLTQELSHQWSGDSIHPDDRGKCITLYNRCISKKIPFEHEFRCLGKNHRDYRWIIETGMPRFSTKGQYQGHTGICIDVTDRVETENKLFEEKERALVTLQSIGDGVITTDAQSIVQFINPVAAHLTGWSFDNAIGQPLDKVFVCINQQTDQIINDFTDQYLAENEVVNLEDGMGLIQRSGQEFSITVTVAPIFDGQGGLAGRVCSFRDITLHKQAQDALEKHQSILEQTVVERTGELQLAMEQAESANLEKSRFLANMSDEIRTPIHAVLGFTDLSLKRIKDGYIESLLRNIKTSGILLTDILNDLLDMAKLEAGNISTEFIKSDFDILVRQCVQGIESLSNKKNLTIQLNSDDHVEGIFDQRLIRQMTINLLFNIINFSLKDSVIKINLHKGVEVINSKEQEVIELIVQGDGIMLPEDEVDTVFDKFKQHRKTDKRIGGTGLGLPICKEIINIHRGKIWAVALVKDNAVQTEDKVMISTAFHVLIPTDI